MPREIKVKTLSKYFEPASDGLKPFEVRSKERDYRVGDILIQREWDPVGGFSGYETRDVITYILDDPEFCPEGMVILGLRKTKPDASKQALREQARSERQRIAQKMLDEEKASGSDLSQDPGTEKRHAKEGETIVITKVLAPGGNGYFEVGDTLYALEIEPNGDVLVYVEHYSHGKKSIYAVPDEYEVVIDA